MNKAQLAEQMNANRLESLARRTVGPSSGVASREATKNAGLANLAGASLIPIDRIIPDPDQPRREFDEEALQQLADSLRDRGQLQPIRVRWSESAGHYIIVVGERRWRAAGIAGMQAIECVRMEGEISAEDLLQDQLAENAIREGLKPVEQARAYKALMEAKGWTLRELADRLHVHFTGIQKAVALLGLDASVQQSVDDGRLAASTAQVIAANIEDPEIQAEAAALVIDGNLNRTEAVEEIKRVATKSKRVRATKGRGASKGRPKLSKEWKQSAASGLKIHVTARKPFDLLTLIEALEEALTSVRGEIVTRQGEGP